MRGDCQTRQPTLGAISGRVVAEWRSYLIDDAVQTADPNGIEDPLDPFTDTTNGKAGSVLSGTPTPDPGQGKWWTWEALDFLNAAMDARFYIRCLAQLREETGAGLSSDTYAACGWCDNPDLDAANAVGCAIHYQAGTRTVRVISITNGVLSAASDSAGAITTRRCAFTCNRREPNKWQTGFSQGYTDPGVVSDAREFVLTRPFNPSLHWWMSFGRTATTPGTEPLEVQSFFVGWPNPSPSDFPV